MFNIFGNDELLQYQYRVREIEKEEKIERELQMAIDKAAAEKRY